MTEDAHTKPTNAWKHGYEAGKRAAKAEVRWETIEECARIADKYAEHFRASRPENQAEQIASAIRSLSDSTAETDYK